jgi:multidrug transporter EmrE-like cation transporter
MFNWLLILFAGVNSTIGNLLLKKSQSSPDFISNIFGIYFFGGCFFYFLNVLLFAYALQELDVSKAYPALVGISFVTLTSIGIIYLNENVSLLNIVGIFVVLIGIILITI